MKVSLEQWQEVEPLLAAALEREGEARAAWLRGIEAAHPRLAPILHRLLESHARAERSHELETVTRLAAPAPWSSNHAPGDRIGPFELLRPIGHGGMGEVWLARQADGRVEREVALKISDNRAQGGVWRERFRRERDILARLAHPHIARLYDAGVTGEGLPWLAMEYVAGLTLLEHVASRPHTLAERLGLFRQVLAAVAHAHRHLVVHRDLKPANVLVDASGSVKLLDFGIAKLLEDAPQADGSGELTRLGGRVMTLRYAAPEQAADGAITTATDIYALGVMLHELVTGLSPYRAVREGKPFTDRMLGDEQSTMPSRLPLTDEQASRCGLGAPRQLARALSGDLDAIVLKAMRRDPAQRYESVERFDADIAAHLQRRPVRAREGTWRYLAGRFAARHKLPLALAAAVLVTLVGGLIAAEGERRQAVAEKARAERHFASVRKLANTFIYDVHAKIENLPGSLEAREMLIATALAYLDTLAGEAGRDPALLLEVASAYRGIAEIQGGPRGANRGNLLASLANFEKSADLLAQLERLEPRDLVADRERWRTSYALANAYFLVVDPRWQPQMRKTRQLAERIAQNPEARHADRALEPFTQGREAHLVNLSTGRKPATEAALVEAIARLEALRREAPHENALREHLVTLYGNAGVMLAGAGEGPTRMRESIGYLEKSLALAEELLAEHPGDRQRRDMQWLPRYNLARELAAEGELRRADELLVEAHARVQRLVARDPDDVAMAVNRLWILVAVADVAVRLGNHERAIGLCRELLAAAAALPKENTGLRELRIVVAEGKVTLGYALLATAEAETRDRERRRALLLETRTLFADVDRFLDDVRAQPTLGAVPEYKLREFARARARLEKALRELAPTAAAQP